MFSFFIQISSDFFFNSTLNFSLRQGLTTCLGWPGSHLDQAGRRDPPASAILTRPHPNPPSAGVKVVTTQAGGLRHTSVQHPGALREQDTDCFGPCDNSLPCPFKVIYCWVLAVSLLAYYFWRILTASSCYMCGLRVVDSCVIYKVLFLSLFLRWQDIPGFPMEGENAKSWALGLSLLHLPSSLP